MEVGTPPKKKGKKQGDTIPSAARHSVRVGNEERGEGWGEGKAKQEFDRLRSEYAKVPNGQHTAHELNEVLSAWRARTNGNS